MSHSPQGSWICIGDTHTLSYGIYTDILLLRTQGWGHYLQYSFDESEYVVENEAVAGRSARSYRREDRFQTIADEAVSGDVSLDTSNIYCPNAIHPSRHES